VLAVAAVLVTAVIGALVALDFALSATALAAEKSDLAEKEAEAKALAAATADQLADKVREFDLLSGIVLLDEAVQREAALGPPWPEHADAMQRWLDEHCQRVLAVRPEVDRVLGDLRARALPRSQEARARDRASHPRSAEYTRLTQFVAAFERAERVRQGAPVPEASPLPHWQAVDDNTLARMAWARTAPLLEQRTILGEEVQGAAMLEALRARRAESFGPNREIQYGYARLAIGDDEGARAAADRAVEAAAAGPDRELEARVIEHHDELLGAVNGVTVELRRLHDECEQLDRILDEQRTFEFAAEADRFLHDTLVRLRVDIQAFDTLQRGRVERRLRFARAIGAATAAHPGAGASWAEVKQALAREGIELPANGIPGLVPIGVNPATGRHEFYHLGSAWDGEQDLAALPVPRRAADGTIPVDDATGIVFVLVPGGRATIGAQRSDPAGAHFDPDAQWYAGPLHQVALDPFLIARHELTQGQWARLWEGDEDGRWPSQYRAGAFLSVPQERVTASHPVTQVDWRTAHDVLRRHGLELPTEVQWEYAARAGTTTPFPCAVADLVRFANLADVRAKSVKAEWAFFEPWDDGFVVTAPVGRFAANAFGLHDVVGNVQEWCADAFDSYERSARRGDGLRDADPGDKRVGRGGSHIDRAAVAKSWMRTPYVATLRAGNLGVRPVQRLPR
jgi:formylglycine-generating enzyme required for sulfatase activity